MRKNSTILLAVCCTIALLGARNVHAAGGSCFDPIEVIVPDDLTYLDTNTTCGTLDDYSISCLGPYDEGEDIIYRLTLLETTSIQITLDPKGTAPTGITLDNACPPDDTCIASSTSSTGDPHGSGCVEIPAGTYSIMIDSSAETGCIPEFDLSIVACELCQDLDGDGYRDAACGGDDCDDSDPLVNPGGTESCDDQIDNDCNGLIDDVDPACFCALPDLTIECGDTVTGSTVGGTSGLYVYPQCISWDESGPEVIYTLVTETDGPIRAEISGLTVDLDIFILADDGGEACVDSCLAYGNWVAFLESAPAGTYHIAVDGYDGAEGAYTLSVDCAPIYFLDVEGRYSPGILRLNYIIGAPGASTWVNYLILTQPQVEVLPLWTVPIPLLDPLFEISIPIPLPSSGLVGIWSALYTATGPEVIDVDWIQTPTP